jgi:hypothetical protein
MLRLRLRLALVRLAPFLSRWSEAAPAACCGVCGSCLTATASGLTLEVIGGVRRKTAADGEHEHERDDPPIACTLGPGEMAERQALIQALVADGMVDRGPIARGVRLRLRATPDIERRARDLVAAESRCCRFLAFDLRHDSGELLLDITGPPEAQEFVGDVFAGVA